MIFLTSFLDNLPSLLFVLPSFLPSSFHKAGGGGTPAKQPKARTIKHCQFEGCRKMSQGKTSFCIAHGGGRRCIKEGCSSNARGSSGLCMARGGGRRCSVDGCKRGAAGATTLCVKHGGGKRCSTLGCPRAAQGGPLGKCAQHGGGRRCLHLQCNKIARGKSPYCASHRVVTSTGEVDDAARTKAEPDAASSLFVPFPGAAGKS